MGNCCAKTLDAIVGVLKGIGGFIYGAVSAVVGGIGAVIGGIGSVVGGVTGGITGAFRKKGPRKPRPPSKSILAMIRFPFGNYDASDPQAALAGPAAAAAARPTST